MTVARRAARPAVVLRQSGVALVPLWQPVQPALVPGEAVPALPSIAATWENTIVELIVTGLVTTALGGNPLLTVIVTLHDPTCVMLNTLELECCNQFPSLSKRNSKALVPMRCPGG